MTTTRPPPQDLLDACDEIDRAIGLVFRDVLEPHSESGRYESDYEARIQFLSVLRHCEAILECARSDLALLPAAYTLARAASEQSCRIRWLMHPGEVHEREARFLALLADEEKSLRKCKEITSVQTFEKQANQIAEFRTAVSAILPAGVKSPKGLPDFRSMLDELGQLQRYVAYARLSQHVHGLYGGGNIYRTGLGNAKVFREDVPASAWALVLEILWWSAFTAAQCVEQVGAGRALRSVTQDDLDRIQGCIGRIREVDKSG